MNQKKQRTLAIFALTVALLATSIAYAALSATLKVSGSATKKGGTWNVHLASPTTPKTTGTGKMTSTPTISGTTLSFGAELSKPGDAIEFNFSVVNGGNIDATLKGITGSFNGTSWTQQASSTSEDVTCSLLYNSQVLSTTTTTVSGTSALSSLDLPSTNKTKVVTVKCVYSSTATSVSSVDKALTFKVSFNYQQTYTK